MEVAFLAAVPGGRRRLVATTVGRRPFAPAVAAILLLCSQAAAVAREGIPVRIASPSAGPPAAERVFHLKDVAQVEESTCLHAHLRLLSYFALLPGLIALALLAFRGRRWLATLVVCSLPLLLALTAEQRAAVSGGVDAFMGGKIAEAERLFGDAEGALGCNPALAYNRALCDYALGRRAAAVAALIRSIQHDPGNAEYRETFALLSAEYGLGSQGLPASVLPPRTLFAGALALANAALIALGMFLARRGGSWFIAFSLLLLAAGTAAGLLVYTELEARAPLAVVAAEAGALRRVPLDQAQVWMTLPQGTSVRTRGRAAAYVLVETGLRVEGWMKSDLLLEPAAAR